MLSPVDIVLQRLESCGCRPRRCGGDEWSAFCPVHESDGRGHKPSLSIGCGRDGRALIHCHAGCNVQQIISTIGLEWRDVFPEEPIKPPPNNKRVRTYPTPQHAINAYQLGKPSQIWFYHNENNVIVGMVARWDRGGEKTYRPIHRVANGWAHGAMPKRRPLYRLPHIINAPPDAWIVVCEGEKTADAAWQCGLIGTTSSGGARAASHTDWRPLRNRRVIILPDNDDSGREYANDVAALCRDAAEVRILDLARYAPSLQLGGDLADVIASPNWCGLPLGESASLEDLGRWIITTASKLPPPTNSTTQQPTNSPSPLDNEFTDTNLARLFTRLVTDEVLYVPAWGWLVWDGQRWKRDEGGHTVARMAMELLPDHYQQRAMEAPAPQRAYYLDLAQKTMSRNRINAVIELSKNLLCTDAASFDRDIYSLNVLNGTIDLRTGQLQPHDPARRITQLAPVEYHADAHAPTWLRFINDITLGDDGLAAFLQTAVGYSVTGDVTEDCMFICWGTGSNGKTTFLNVISAIIGDYARHLSTDIIVSRSSRSDHHPTLLADLYGARFCATTETDEDGRLDEPRVKALTGRDPVRARFLYREYFQFSPTHKIWLATNHLPYARDTTEGFWRRIRLVPFRAFFNSHQRDPHLHEKLLAEAPGILRWIVEGAVRFCEERLPMPATVYDATQQYRSDADILADWLAECCYADASAITPVADLYTSYRTWCEQHDEKPLSQRAFGRRLSEKGYQSLIKPGGKRCRCGIGLR